MRGKTDAANAEAIAEAVQRPNMRFVAVKTKDQQAVLMLHKVRDLLVRQRIMLINALRGHPAKFGIVTAQGAAGVTRAITQFRTEQASLPEWPDQRSDASSVRSKRSLRIAGAW